MAFSNSHTRIYINGRFLTQSTTDVQRYAHETLKAIVYLFSGEWLGSTPELWAREEGAVAGGTRLRAGVAGGKSVGY